MTTKEFSNQFDIYFNGIAKNDAPPIDLYEKSVYLTRAQLELVNNYFNPNGNKYKQGFEQSSKRRADLKELIRPGLTTNTNTGFTEDDGISPNSQFFKLPQSVYMIIQEKAKVSSSDDCVDDKYIKVVPKTHDEFNIQENNPFKNPDQNVIWRVDIYDGDPSGESTPGYNEVVELISPYTITEYKFRYIIYPSPIILCNLLTEFPAEDLSIDGVSLEQTCKLGENIHPEILNRAVELAIGDYYPDRLPTKFELNKRNE